MGESAVDASKVQNKMGESALDVGALHVSVSFGRFENDSLRWEKWSAFPTNKYLEEVEKCSTPGSVAQKKAYFEAHYKKIAARKAEQMDQEKKDSDPVDFEDQNQRDSVNNTCVEEMDLAKSNGHNTFYRVKLENPASDAKKEINGSSIENIANGIDLQHEVINLRTESSSSSRLVEPNNELTTACESEDQLSPVVDAKDEFHSRVDDLGLGEAEEHVLVKEDAPSSGSQERTDNTSSIEPTPRPTNAQVVNSERSKKPEKVTTHKKPAPILATKKKQSSPAVRSPVVSTPKQLKPALSRPVTSVTRPTAERKNGFTPLSGKKTAPAASKRVASPSLHMSLSWGPANSDPGSLATRRKSLIMERMGDKDIIKRAFRTFQNNFGQVTSPSLAKSSPTHQLPQKETERKTWASTTPQKSNEGANDSTKKMFTLHGQQGTRRTPSSTGLLLKGIGSVKNSTTISSFDMKSHDRADKLKVFPKKTGEEISAKEAERTLLQSKMKVQKDAEFKKLQQSLNFKAKPLPAFYRGSGVGKSSTYNKKVAKSEAGD
ncbi:hypothetical protein Dimus_015010 [Dionaea muscipula]